MKSLLQNVNEVDEIIRLLQKMESKLRAGQIIDAWRECTRIIALLQKAKQNLIAESEKPNDK